MNKRYNMGIREYLKTKKLIADGAFGTYFSQINNTNETISERANLTNPELVLRIHSEYIKSGARLIRTNTFAANTRILGGTAAERDEIIRSGYRLAWEAVNRSGCKVFVAADIGPIPEDLHSEPAEIMDEYLRICDCFLECGAEVFVFETFPNVNYIKKIVKYIKEKNKDAFIITQFCINRYGYTKSGISASRLFAKAGSIEEIDAVGFNCGIGPSHLYQVLKKMKFETGKYVSAMPNSSYPEMLQDRMVYLDNIQYFGEKMQSISELGVSILGGCCGTTPLYIEETMKRIDFSPVDIGKMHMDREKTEPEAAVNNKFYRKLLNGEKVIAVELDPPYDAKVEKIMECANILKAGNVDILTFADSPMGRGRVDSILMSAKVGNEVGIPVMPHIACRDKNVIAMRAGILGGYINNIRNLLIVTGDPIPSGDRDETTSVFDFNSVKLMEFVKEMNVEHFSEERIVYGGALNHGRANIDKEIERMQKKIEAGASYFLTQPIFSDEDVDRIHYIKSRVDTKILCGIMPLISYRNASFIKNEIAGIHVPKEIVDRYSPDMTREEGEATGVAIAREVMAKLGDVADGFYFMLPFNRVHLVEGMLKNEQKSRL